MLRRPARVELQLRLKRPDGQLTVVEQFEDPNARWMTERAKHAGLRLVHRARIVGHDDTVLEILKTWKVKR